MWFEKFDTQHEKHSFHRVRARARDAQVLRPDSVSPSASAVSFFKATLAVRCMKPVLRRSVMMSVKVMTLPPSVCLQHS